jgi:hypothetical protein
MDYFANLTPQQARFCAEYFVDLNATQAAIRAGYSKATASNGKLMASPNIKLALQQRSAELNAEHELARHQVFVELKKIAFATIGDYFDEAGKPKPLHLVDADAKAALLSYNLSENDKGSSLKIRLNSKLSALEKIARHIGFYGLGLKPEAVAQVPAVQTYSNGQVTDKYHPADGGPVKYEGDDEEHEEDIIRWIQEARELAIYQTETRLRAEFEEEKKKEARTGMQGQQVVGDNTNNGGEKAVGGDTDNGVEKKKQEARIKMQDSNQDSTNGVVGVKNTDKSPPVGGDKVAGAGTDNGGVVKKKRTYTIITAKYTPQRTNWYLKK